MMKLSKSFSASVGALEAIEAKPVVAKPKASIPSRVKRYLQSLVPRRVNTPIISDPIECLRVVYGPFTLIEAIEDAYLSKSEDLDALMSVCFGENVIDELEPPVGVGYGPKTLVIVIEEEYSLHGQSRRLLGLLALCFGEDRLNPNEVKVIVLPKGEVQLFDPKDPFLSTNCCYNLFFLYQPEKLVEKDAKFSTVEQYVRYFECRRPSMLLAELKFKRPQHQ
ncbi:MAG: hypothetical protein J0M07_21595 [Anaerolineae bacterium]|nr:hypothetical protein [Anaerolineae bacterium]